MKKKEIWKYLSPPPRWRRTKDQHQKQMFLTRADIMWKKYRKQRSKSREYPVVHEHHTTHLQEIQNLQSEVRSLQKQVLHLQNQLQTQARYFHGILQFRQKQNQFANREPSYQIPSFHDQKKEIEYLSSQPKDKKYTYQAFIQRVEQENKLRTEPIEKRNRIEFLQKYRLEEEPLLDKKIAGIQINSSTQTEPILTEFEKIQNQLYECIRQNINREHSLVQNIEKIERQIQRCKQFLTFTMDKMSQ